MVQVLYALKRGTALCEHSAAGHAIIPGAPRPRKLTCNADASLLVLLEDGHDEAMCAECFAELYIDRGNRRACELCRGPRHVGKTCEEAAGLRRGTS